MKIIKITDLSQKEREEIVDGMEETIKELKSKNYMKLDRLESKKIYPGLERWEKFKDVNEKIGRKSLHVINELIDAYINKFSEKN